MRCLRLVKLMHYAVVFSRALVADPGAVITNTRPTSSESGDERRWPKSQAESLDGGLAGAGRFGLRRRRRWGRFARRRAQPAGALAAARAGGWTRCACSARRIRYPAPGCGTSGAHHLSRWKRDRLLCGLRSARPGVQCAPFTEPAPPAVGHWSRKRRWLCRHGRAGGWCAAIM